MPSFGVLGLLIGTVITAVAAGNSSTPIYLDPSYSPRERAEDLLPLLSWTEKVGQMGGIRRLLSANVTFNSTSFVIINATQNGILGFGNQLNDPYAVLPIANEVREEQANSSKIPYITVTDSVNGPYLEGGTLFPATLSMASSFNVPLYSEVVAAIRDENMALGTHWVLSPELDVAKEPRYGRVGETYGEDQFMISEFGTAYVKTMQETDENGYIKVATTIKHFVYGVPNGGTNTASQFGGINYLFNDLMPPFIKTIRDAKPLSIMASYATVDKVPMSENKYMLQTILRQSLNFTGVIMSDAEGIARLYTTSNTATSYTHAALKSVKAGLQLELSPAQPAMFPNLESYSNDSSIVTLVDEAILGLLEIKFATGTFDLPLPTIEGLNTTLRAPSHLDVNRNISRESIVLLQNENASLPFQSTVTKVAVLGPYATVINAGSYAATNSTNPAYGDSFLTSLQNELGTSNVIYEQGVDFLDTSDDSGIASAVSAAQEADVAVLMLGALSVNTEDPLYSKRTDGEFFTHASLGFPGLQQDLLDAVLDAGVPTVLIMSGGQGFVLNNSTLLRTGAILHSFLSGEYTGDSLVEVLTGATNPSGKLPISLPQFSGATPIYYNYLPSDLEDAWSYPYLTRNPPMPFGYGLSYTTFNISSPTAVAGSGIWNISVTVSNTGDVDGKEVVQVYFRQQYTNAIETPVKQLVSFQKVFVAAGEQVDVVLTVSESDLGLYSDGVWMLESGDYTFYVGSSSRAVDLRSVNVTIPAN